MGAADIVPGVSGGTVALVLGIYDRLIHNIRIGAGGLKQLLTGNITALKQTLREIEWMWLIALLVGILAAVATLSSVLERLLEEQTIAMAGLFFGLVLGIFFGMDRGNGRFEVFQRQLELVRIALLRPSPKGRLFEGSDQLFQPFYPLVLALLARVRDDQHRFQRGNFFKQISGLRHGAGLP